MAMIIELPYFFFILTIQNWIITSVSLKLNISLKNDYSNTVTQYTYINKK